MSLPNVSIKLITTHNLCSQAHSNNNPSTSVQVSVHHTRHQVIKHILFLNFMQLQYVLPLSSICKSHAVYSNTTLKIQCISGMPTFPAYSCVKIPENTEMKLPFIWWMSYVIFNAYWTPLITQFFSQCAVLEHTSQLLIISSELNVRGLIKPPR